MDYRILPLKGSGETGIQQDDGEKESQKKPNHHQDVATADWYLLTNGKLPTTSKTMMMC